MEWEGKDKWEKSWDEIKRRRGQMITKVYGKEVAEIGRRHEHTTYKNEAVYDLEGFYADGTFFHKRNVPIEELEFASEELDKNWPGC